MSKKTIVGIASTLGVLVVVVIACIFLLGPSGVFASVGQTVLTRVDDVFQSIGMDFGLADMYGDAFDAGITDGGIDL